MPFARASKHVAAVITQLIFASACTRAASDLVKSASSGPSLIRGVALSTACSSSRTSFLSFHFDEVSAVGRAAGSLEAIDSGSANARGSKLSASVMLVVISRNLQVIQLSTHLHHRQHHRPSGHDPLRHLQQPLRPLVLVLWSTFLASVTLYPYHPSPFHQMIPSAPSPVPVSSQLAMSLSLAQYTDITRESKGCLQLAQSCRYEQRSLVMF